MKRRQHKPKLPKWFMMTERTQGPRSFFDHRGSRSQNQDCGDAHPQEEERGDALHGKTEAGVTEDGSEAPYRCEGEPGRGVSALPKSRPRRAVDQRECGQPEKKPNDTKFGQNQQEEVVRALWGVSEGNRVAPIVEGVVHVPVSGPNTG